MFERVMPLLVGLLAREAGKMKYVGKVGRELTVDVGQAAARLCAKIDVDLGEWRW